VNATVSILPYLGTQIPEILALIAGVIVALVNFGKDRRKAGFGLIAFGLALVAVVLNLVVLLVTISLQTAAGYSFLVTSLFSAGGNCFVTLLPAAAWVLILLALFGKTRTSPSP
jgi:hypothetical protein